MMQALLIVMLLGLLYLGLRVAWFVVRTALRIVVRGSGTAIGHMEKANADLAARAAQARADAGKVAPNRRRWALALGDILLLRNGLRCDSDALALELPAEQRQRLAKQVLREMNMAADLPERDIATQMQAALVGWVSGLGRTHANFYEQLAAEGKVRDALAFDCARTAFLVRCIALLGWVPESQAWLVLFLNAQRAQDSFESWEDFGHAYARARLHWLRISSQDGPASSRATLEVQEHLQNTQGNWLTLPWKRYRIFDPQPTPISIPAPAASA
ncbi:DUF1266 domain-containing protein [Variovorax sp. 38R]|uniref:DUF1266 domain-containing protein n=1 Tax=Variovorax sp. 38R TaxID=2774875 RepID=UPI001CE1B514|nr:DUF1266 domain-containing protein [Variovorax sp. 38R]